MGLQVSSGGAAAVSISESDPNCFLTVFPNSTWTERIFFKISKTVFLYAVILEDVTHTHKTTKRLHVSQTSGRHLRCSPPAAPGVRGTQKMPRGPGGEGHRKTGGGRGRVSPAPSRVTCPGPRGRGAPDDGAGAEAVSRPPPPTSHAWGPGGARCSLVSAALAAGGEHPNPNPNPNPLRDVLVSVCLRSEWGGWALAVSCEAGRGTQFYQGFYTVGALGDEL